jgi:hypothetical protein
MVESVNDKIHDDLISHDIRLQRVAGDTRKRIERRLDKLGSDLKAITARIDPFSASGAAEGERRLSKLNEESTELINEAYKEINKWQRDQLERLAAIETEATVQAVRKALP